MMKIEMSKFYPEHSFVLSGREYGKSCRQRCELDKKETKETTIDIIFDQKLYSLNISFFLSFFGPSIVKFGRDDFMKKYKFIGAEDIVSDVISQGVDLALKNRTALE